METMMQYHSDKIIKFMKKIWWMKNDEVINIKQKKKKTKIEIVARKLFVNKLFASSM